MSAPSQGTQRTCCAHICDNAVKDEVEPFSEITWNKLVDSATKWVSLDGQESQISQDLLSLSVSGSKSNVPSSYGIHKQCYRRLTDVTKISRAVKRIEKRRRVEECEGNNDEPARKSVRLSLPSSAKPKRNRYILNPECIICQKVKYKKDAFSKKKMTERLSNFEFIEGGRVLEAARLRNDENLLLRLNEKDLVATEAKYHRSCYRSLISVIFAHNKNKASDTFKRADFYESSSSSSGSQSDSDNENYFSSTDWSLLDNCTLYYAARILNNLIKEIKGLDTWPPTADDLGLNHVQRLVPPQLYNFLAWTAGASDEISPDGYVQTRPDIQRVLLSVAQDVMYLSSGKRNIMPKHYALGMTIRHTTGSSTLINLLNGLGHCVSHSTVLQHDTALTDVQYHKNKLVPDGFVEEQSATLVWDNNDFNEETRSGAGTTHNTTGILVQKQVIDGSVEKQRVILPKTKKRSCDPPPKLIETYYTKQQKSGPPRMEAERCPQSNEILSPGFTTDIAFCLSKLPEVEGKLLPNWTGFNTIIDSVQVSPPSKVGYLPVIDASPTEMSTVYTILLKSIAIADELKLDNIVVVFDQAIYAKAQQIRWQNPVFQERLVIRLGDFHTTMCFMAVIGKRFECSGLEDILIEAEAVAPGSIGGVMSGHNYNRSVRTHKSMYEALQRLRWKSFLGSLSEEERSDVLSVAKQLNTLGPCTAFTECINDVQLKTVFENYTSYVTKRREDCPTFDFWSSYLDMSALLLQFIRATREGLWELHLSVLHEMLPWFFAYDRVNYARYVPAYLAEMYNLKNSHPQVYHTLITDGFTVQRHEQYGFSRVAFDQLIEQTINRDSKTKGGMSGITLSQGAVNRWILSHHERAAISNACKEMAWGGDIAARPRKDLNNTVISRDESTVQSLADVTESMVNPFMYDGDDLINLSSGIVAPDLQPGCNTSVKFDLEHAYGIGEAAANSFFTERISNGGSEDLFKPLKQIKLKTFAVKRSPKTSIKVKSEVMSLKSCAELFARLLFIGKIRDFDLKELLTYSLTTVPSSIATHDGMNVKTDKAKLMHILERQVSENVCQDNSSRAEMADDSAEPSGVSRVEMADATSAEHVDLSLAELSDVSHDAEMANATSAELVDLCCAEVSDVSRVEMADATSAERFDLTRAELISGVSHVELSDVSRVEMADAMSAERFDLTHAELISGVSHVELSDVSRVEMADAMSAERFDLTHAELISGVSHVELSDVSRVEMADATSAERVDLSHAKLSGVSRVEMAYATSAERVDVSTSALIVDAMALLHSIQNIPQTFGLFADHVLINLVSMAHHYKCKRVDFVTDLYPEVSIKNCEHIRRSSSGAFAMKITRNDQKVPKQYKKYLSVGANKEALLNFFFEHWKDIAPSVYGGVAVYATHGNQCHVLKSSSASELVVNEVSELCCDHEEADTRMFLHAMHASKSNHTVLIRSPDTDVMVLGITHASTIKAKLMFLTGVGYNLRTINLTAIARALGSSKCEALLGLHCFTGCDSVSAFKGKGKIKPLQLMLDSADYCDVFKQIGQEFIFKENDLKQLEPFVCKLYGDSSVAVNDARYNIFRLKTVSESSLPPNKDCLLLHAKRANYQCAVYRRALQQQIKAPSPVGHGWLLESNALSFQWMTLPPAPSSLWKDVHCKCKKSGCVTKLCSCQSAGFKCTELCNCMDCDNCVDRLQVLVDDNDDDDQELDGN